MTKWVAESGDGKIGLARPAGVPKALNPKACLVRPRTRRRSRAGRRLAKGHETPAENGEKRPDRERVVVGVARNPAADLR